MTHAKRFLWAAALSVLLALTLAGCSHGSGDGGNLPYEPDTPAPAAHDGTFVSAHGTMVFNGDGKSVTIDFDDELAGRMGLPAGEQEASYVFTSGYLPPHGYVDVHYDVAMELWLTVGEGDGAVTAMVDIGKYENGSFSSGTGCTTEDRITFFVETPDGREALDFLKS